MEGRMYTQDNYRQLLNDMENLADEKYKNFQGGLIPNVNNIIGVSVPKLRNIAKQLLKECDSIESYFKFAGNKYYEETMLQGIIIGYLKCPWEQKLRYIADFVPKINDWAVCDVFCGGIKPPKEKLDSFREFIAPYLHKQGEYQVRFGVVMLMQKFISDQYISSTLQSLKNINRSEYYIQMAVAWALSICYIKYPQLTLELFKEKSLQKWVQNKAIQKCRESLRVTNEDKVMLLKYKM